MTTTKTSKSTKPAAKPVAKTDKARRPAPKRSGAGYSTGKWLNSAAKETGSFMSGFWAGMTGK